MMTTNALTSSYNQKYPDIEKFLDQASSAMLGYSPNWRKNLFSTVDSALDSYPPYDLIRVDEHTYRIVIAAAGFSKNELDVVVENQRLTISGEKEKRVNEDVQKTEYLHKGIGTRKFSRSFMLAENVKVASADYVDGLLTLEVVHEVPEEQKPKQIPIM